MGARSSKHTVLLSETVPVIDMAIAGRAIVAKAKARIVAYGALFGIEENAAQLVGRIKSRIEEAKKAVAGKGDALVVVTNSDRISAFGVDSRFGWLHDTVGLPEAATGLVAKPRGHTMTIEQIDEIDPDWLIIVDRQAAIGRGGSAANAMLQEGLAANRAGARKINIINLDAAPLYIASGGAASMLQTLDEIISAFSVNEERRKPR